MNCADGLDRLNLEPVPVKPEWRISPDVIDAAHGQPVILTLSDERADLTCERCGQSVMCLRAGHGSYRLTAAAISGQLLAHLMQTHGWTREGTGG